MRGYNFFGKPLRLNYARSQSDVIAKMRGTYEDTNKARREQRRLQEIKIKAIKQKKKLIDKFLRMRQDTEEMQVFKKKAGGVEEANNTLFIEGLAKVTKTEVLNELFSGKPGFKEVRHVVEKMVAFVEFENEEHAGLAMMALQGFAIKENNGENTTLRISFAKR